jgi:O-antigen ligase
VSLERTQAGLLAAIAATCLVSIFAAQLLLALAVAVYVFRLTTGAARFQRLPLDAPILAFCIWTLLSASFSPDPVASHESTKKLVLFALLYVAADSLASPQQRERILDAALLGGLVLGGGALIQYYVQGFNTLNNRPHSFLGHYMTASGLSMGVLCLAAARLAFWHGAFPRISRGDLARLGGLAAALALLTLLQALDLFAVTAGRVFVAALAIAAAALAVSRRSWPAPSTSFGLASLTLLVSSWALVISRTRNAWLGAVAGLATVILVRAPRALWLIPAGIAAVLVVGPEPVLARLTVTDAASRDRYYMWQAGLDMIEDKPVFGQGPGMILTVYPEYRWAEAPNRRAPHLHDNALQIAAERGLPCLIWWIWLVAEAMGSAYRELPRRDAFRSSQGLDPRWVGAASLAILVAVMVAGLFEYNFGDSEILMFVLLVMALPSALRRQRAAGVPA